MSRPYTPEYKAKSACVLCLRAFPFFLRSPAVMPQRDINLFLAAGHRAELPQVLGRRGSARPRPLAPDERQRHPGVRLRPHDRHAGEKILHLRGNEGGGELQAYCRRWFVVLARAAASAVVGMVWSSTIRSHG